MLQKHILQIKKQNVANQSEIEELEQYGGMQCHRLDGVHIEKNEVSDKVLTKVMDLCKEAGVNVPNTVIVWEQRIVVAYVDNKSIV